MTILILGLIPPVALLSAVLTGFARAIGRRRALLDSAGASGHAKALRGVPNIGGVAIFWSVVGPLAAGLGALWLGLPGMGGGGVGGEFAAALERHTAGARAQTPMALGLIGCLAALHGIGLLDDRRALGAAPKLLVMLGAAGVMAVGFDVRLLTMLDGHVGGAWLSIVVTMLWLVTITNAMNFMDNADGLAGSVGVVSGTLFLAATLINGQWFVAGTLALMIGALLGFLCFNFPRAEGRGGVTIFMGDGGSLVMGFLLAFLTVRTTYVRADGGGGDGRWYGVFMPICVLAVPLYDLVSVSIIRIASGRSPFVGDQSHFSHRLRGRGLSARRMVVVISGCAAITGIGGVLLTRAAPWQAALIGVQTVLNLVVLGVYEAGSRRSEGA